VLVEGLDWTTVHTDDAYDLTIDDLHTFYVAAGDENVLVHHADPWSTPAEWASSKWREIRSRYRNDTNYPSGQHDAGIRASIRELSTFIRENEGSLLPEVLEELRVIVKREEGNARGIGHQ
jgi:hypothetical protein